MGYSAWGHRELDTTEQLTNNNSETSRQHLCLSMHCISFREISEPEKAETPCSFFRWDAGKTELSTTVALKSGRSGGGGHKVL